MLQVSVILVSKIILVVFFCFVLVLVVLFCLVLCFSFFDFC